MEGGTIGAQVPLAAGELLLRQCLQQEQRNVEVLHAQLQATVQALQVRGPADCLKRSTDDPVATLLCPFSRKPSPNSTTPEAAAPA